jgi:hypothetical protein
MYQVFFKIDWMYQVNAIEFNTAGFNKHHCATKLKLIFHLSEDYDIITHKLSSKLDCAVWSALGFHFR